MITTVRAETQIRELLAGKAEAMREKDADRLVSRYAPGWLDTFDGPLDYEIRDLTVTVGEDVAFCHSLDRLTATPLVGTEPFSLWFRVTVGLCRVDGSWRVTHEHSSTPFLMDGSFRAAADLQP